MNRRLPRIAQFAIAFGVTFALACAPQPLKVEVDGESSISLNSPRDSHQVKVTVYDRDGREIPKPKLRFYSINSAIAEVTPAGLILPKDDGRTRVVVRSGYSQHEVVVNVRFYADLIPAKSAYSFHAGDSSQLTAQVIDRRGAEVPNATLEWASSDPSVVSVDENGALVARNPGLAKVTVKAGKLVKAIDVEVLEARPVAAS